VSRWLGATLGLAAALALAVAAWSCAASPDAGTTTTAGPLGSPGTTAGPSASGSTVAAVVYTTSTTEAAPRLYRIEVNNKYGFIDAGAEAFSGGLAWVTSRDQSGAAARACVDQTGTTVWTHSVP
jgi:hypothetical protein